jgi:DNA polymerase III delta prime subunit
MPRIEHIIKEEAISITDEGKKALLKLSKGDMRRVINVLQVSMKFNTNVWFKIQFRAQHFPFIHRKLPKRQFTSVSVNRNLKS